MSVDVSAGRALYAITNTNLTPSKTYKIYHESDAVVTVPIATADPTNPRIDIIVMQCSVATNPDSSSGNIASIIVVKGTAAGSPSAPATPANSLLLANIAVAAGAASIVTANITDERAYVQVNSGNLLDIARATETAALRNDTPTWLGTVSGTNTITGTASPAPTAYVAGQRFAFIVAVTNTGSVTLNVNSLGAKTIMKSNGSTNLIANDFIAGQLVEVRYDGTNFQLISFPATLGASTNYSKIVAMSSTDPSGATISGTTLFTFPGLNYTIPANDLVAGVMYEIEATVQATTGTSGTFEWGVALGAYTSMNQNSAAFLGTNVSFNAKFKFYGTAAAGGSVTVKVEAQLVDGQAATDNAYIQYLTTSQATNGTLAITLFGKFGTSNGGNAATARTWKVTRHSTTAS